MITSLSNGGLDQRDRDVTDRVHGGGESDGFDDPVQIAVQKRFGRSGGVITQMSHRAL